MSWDIRTKQERTKKIRCFVDGQPAVNVLWLSSTELAIASQRCVCVWDITDDDTPRGFLTFDHVWGMVHLEGASEFLVGTMWFGGEAGPGLCTIVSIPLSCRSGEQCALGLPTTHRERLTCPTFVGNQVACIALPSGVWLFDIGSQSWSSNLPLLDGATSIGISLTRNLVVQTNDSIQIFSVDVLKSGEVRKNARSSHVYPLGEKHIICVLEPNRHRILLELETLREFRPGDQIYQLSRWAEATNQEAPLSALSPSCTWVVTTTYDLPQRELRVKYLKDGITLTKIPLELGDLGVGEVYGLTFDSETRFHLKIDGPGWHVQIPYDIILSPSEFYSHTITQGESLPLSEPRVKPPYTLDASCEWVIDAEFRKICWISPENVRRGNGGHFWVGLSLVMVGDDRVVRKLTFKEPDY